MKTFKFTSMHKTDGSIINKFYFEGTSAEREALETTNGSEFTETDTGNTYIFEADSKAWTQKQTGGGGGGEPSAYLKSISVSGQTITITDKGGNNTSFSLDKLPHGTTLPSGQYEGQIFNYEGTEIRKGIYQYNGSLWNLIAAVGGEEPIKYTHEYTYTNSETSLNGTFKED